MSEYYNSHTHNTCHEHSVFNLRVRNGACDVPDCDVFSVGIHPYDYKNFEQSWMVRVREIATDKRCVAIGECGIDKRFSDIEKQNEIFAAQCAIAAEVEKPIIIHCVKSQSEVLKNLKNFTLPIIFHGYTKKIERENIYYSLSLRNIKNSDNLPLDKILLETDDSTEKIKENYEALALRRGLDIDELKLILEKTFYTIFKR